MIAQRDPERRFAIAAALLLPWLMLLVTDWTVTPVGMIDAWIYRALGRDLVHANASMGDYYYAARPFVLVPRYFLTRFFVEGVAHAAYGLICAHLLLFAVLDFLTSVARPGTRLLGVLLFGTCLPLLRSLGWGYVDGSIITWFVIALAGLARWYRPGATGWGPRLGALLAGGCFAAMLSTHPMALPMLLTPLGFVLWAHRQAQPPLLRRPWLEVVVGGVAALVLMGLLCKLLYDRFFFIMPILTEARDISASAWKKPVSSWLPEANWLVIVSFAWLSALALLVTAKARRAQLTSFEGFASFNVLAVMTVVLATELFTQGYWLEYPYFTSYFLPSALLALAALLGERARALTARARAGLLAVFVCGAALAHRLESAWVVPSIDARFFPFRTAEPWLGAVPLTGLQLGLALLALVGLVAWRSIVRRPAARSLLVVGAMVAVVLGGPINHIAPGDAVEAEAAAAVAKAIVLIQDELEGRRPAYWYEAENPLASLFVTISSGHLGVYSQLRERYPQGAKALKKTGQGSVGLYEAGDPVVILDETGDRFPWAQQSFSAIGITLKETRRVSLPLGTLRYTLIFATLEPNAARLQVDELPTALKAPALINGARVSERERGFLSYGPYVPLAAGPHRVTFHLRVLDKPDADTVAVVDVGGDMGGPRPATLLSAPVLASSAGANGELDVTLEFTLKAPTPRAEFRVLANGVSRLALCSIDVLRPSKTGAPPADRLLTASSTLGCATTDPEYVKGLYRELLGREADAEGLQAHLGALASGMSREALRLAFLESAEYRNAHPATENR